MTSVCGAQELINLSRYAVGMSGDELNVSGETECVRPRPTNRRI